MAWHWKPAIGTIYQSRILFETDFTYFIDFRIDSLKMRMNPVHGFSFSCRNKIRNNWRPCWWRETICLLIGRKEIDLWKKQENSEDNLQTSQETTEYAFSWVIILMILYKMYFFVLTTSLSVEYFGIMEAELFFIVCRSYCRNIVRCILVDPLSKIIIRHFCQVSKRWKN